MKFCFVCLTLLIFWQSSICQEGSLLFHHLKLEDGLSELTNQYVYKDSEGFIWISSLDGLNRFDGTKVKSYIPDAADSLSLFDGLVQSNFFEDSSSFMWFSTYRALNSYDRKHDCFYHYRVNSFSDHPPGDYNLLYLDTKNQLWLSTDDSWLYTFNIITHVFRPIVKFQADAQRGSVIADAMGRVQRIFSYYQVSVGLIEIQIDKDEQVVSQTRIGYRPNELLYHISKIICEGDSLLWIATHDAIIRYNFITSGFTKVLSGEVQTIENFNDSILLVSIDKQGIYEFNKRTLTLGYQYKAENGNPLSLFSNSIIYISKDVDDGFWCSGTTGISYALRGKKKFQVCKPEITENITNANFNAKDLMIDHSGRILCSTDKGIFELDRDCKTALKLHSTEPELQSRLENPFSVLEDSLYHLWLFSGSGLSLLSHSFEALRIIPQAYFYGVKLGCSMYFCNVDKGIDEFDITGNLIGRVKPNSLNESYTAPQIDHRGRLWLHGGLDTFLILDPHSFTVLNHFSVPGFCAPLITSTDGHTIWIASLSGLYNIDADSLKIRNVYKRINDISFTGLYGMELDHQGRLWITSNKGLIVFNPQDSTTSAYTYEDGLPVFTILNCNATLHFPDGEIWFSSSNGIVKFYPEEIKPIKTEAFPQITELLINDQPPVSKLICEESQNTNISEIRKLTFSYLDNTLTFIINALEYSSPAHNKVKYWMEGIDSDSIETTSGSRIRYPNLAAGKYTFCVTAANSDGHYSPLIRKMQIIIKPPFYKTWWFITSMILLTLGPIIYIFYLRISKKLELQKVRLGLYENLHDDVGSRLMSISMTADELINQDKSTDPKVLHISKVAKSIVGNMKRLVWAIDPENDSMNSMVQKLRYDKSLILSDSILFHLELDEPLSAIIVPGEIRYQITSIVNEALNNISKYAKAKNVWIEFSKSERVMTMIIRDDGIGFIPEHVSRDTVKSSGYGLGNMQKRVARVKGSIHLTSKPGEGTTIMATIPFK